MRPKSNEREATQQQAGLLAIAVAIEDVKLKPQQHRSNMNKEPLRNPRKQEDEDQVLRLLTSHEAANQHHQPSHRCDDAIKSRFALLSPGHQSELLRPARSKTFSRDRQQV